MNVFLAHPLIKVVLHFASFVGELSQDGGSWAFQTRGPLFLKYFLGVLSSAVMPLGKVVVLVVRAFEGWTKHFGISETPDFSLGTSLRITALGDLKTLRGFIKLYWFHGKHRRVMVSFILYWFNSQDLQYDKFLVNLATCLESLRFFSWYKNGSMHRN